MKKLLRISLYFFALSSFLFRPYAFGKEAPLLIAASIEFVSFINWNPSICTLYLNPMQIDTIANYSFPQPITLQTYSSSEHGWKVLLESEYSNVNNEFLLMSEDRQHTLRYVFTSNQTSAGNYRTTVYKHRDTVIDRPGFAPEAEARTLYATLIGGQAHRVPGGYYTATVNACFYDQ